MGICLFCNLPEENYTPAKGTDFICSGCIQLLLKFDQDELKQGYALAVQKGYTGKARAIESFIMIGIGDNEQRRPKSKKHERHLNRKGINRPVRSQKSEAGRFAASA